MSSRNPKVVEGFRGDDCDESHGVGEEVPEVVGRGEGGLEELGQDGERGWKGVIIGKRVWGYITTKYVAKIGLLKNKLKMRLFTMNEQMCDRLFKANFSVFSFYSFFLNG